MFWRQDHKWRLAPGTPGFIDHVANKRPEVVRVYLPTPDANTLLVGGRPLPTQPQLRPTSWSRARQPALTYLNHGTTRSKQLHAAVSGIWHMGEQMPLASQMVVVWPAPGDVPTLENAGRRPDILRRRDCPTLRVRVIMSVDIMRLEPRLGASTWSVRQGIRPRFFGDDHFPVIFAYHGYPVAWDPIGWTYRRKQPWAHFHVRGFKERGHPRQHLSTW